VVCHACQRMPSRSSYSLQKWQACGEYLSARCYCFHHVCSSPHIDLPSYYRTTRLVSEITGVESVVHRMCINSCVAYTGPFLNLEACPICSEPRYDNSSFARLTRLVPASRLCAPCIASYFGHWLSSSLNDIYRKKPSLLYTGKPIVQHLESVRDKRK
jgi:hypothetical protein